jgi:DNA-binding NarL/FixJ family response regulator
MNEVKKILVIEDEAEMRRNLLTVLKLEKFHAIGAENGRVGIELAKKERPHLILCTKPVAKTDLLSAIGSRLARAAQQSTPEFRPDFSSAEPLYALGLTPRVAEVLLWVAQGKTNSDIANILGISESTVKKHMIEIMQTLGVETRTAASLQALEVLSSGSAKRRSP